MKPLTFLTNRKFQTTRCSWIAVFPVWLIMTVSALLNLSHELAAQNGGGGELCNFSANLTVGCTGISVDFSANPNWPTHIWDFGDGTEVSGGQDLSQVSHDYVDINPFLTPVIARHRLDTSSAWCEQEIVFPGIFIGEGCGSTRILSNLASAGIFSANELSDQTLFIFGDLEVDIAYTFNACSLQVIAGGKIIVQPGGKLTLSNGTVADNHEGNGGCDRLWTGFEVKTGGQLVSDGATIQDAYFGIRPILSKKGLFPLISLTNTTFTRDFIGIYAANGPFGFPVFSGNNFTGSGNNAILPLGTCNPPIEIPGVSFAARTYSGIYFDGYNGGELVLPDGASVNYFAGLQVGIVALNGNTTIVNCQFEDIAAIYGNNALQQGTAVTFADNQGTAELNLEGLGKDGDFTVSDCERGIFASTSKGHTRVFVKNCRMEEVQNGVVLTEAASGNLIEVAVENNYIDCSKFVGKAQINSTAVEINDPNPWHSVISILGNDIEVNQPLAFGIGGNDLIFPTGILVTALLPQTGVSKNAMLLDIRANTIEMTAGIRGIRVSNVANATIQDNTIHNVSTDEDIPIHCMDVEGGISNRVVCNQMSSDDICFGVFTDSFVGFKLDGNTTTGMYVGLIIANDNGTDCVLGSNTLEPPASPGYPTYGLVYNFALTGPQYLKGNLWDGDFAVGAVFAAGPTFFTYCDSRYLVSTAANIGGSSTNSVLIEGQTQACGDWFIVSSELDEDRHNCEQAPEAPGLNLNEADLHLASSGGTAQLSPGFQWSAEMGLYRKFTEYPELIDNNATITNFMQNLATEPLVQTYAIRNEFVNLYDDPYFEALLEDIYEATSDTRTAMNAIQPASSAAAWAGWSALGNQLDSLTELAVSTLGDYAVQIAANAASVIAENAAVECGAQPCANEQFLHDLFLETQIAQPRPLDSTEQEQIRTLASTCPGDGGPAVFPARAWYYLLTGEIVQDSCNNLSPGAWIEERMAALVCLPLLVQPNPASTFTLVNIPALESGALLLLRDFWGRIVWQAAVEKGRQTVQIPTEAMASGIYTVVLSDTGFALPAPVKLIITH